MNQLRASKLAKHIGGRWAISLQGCLIYAPLAIAFVPIGENAYSDWGLLWRWSTVAVISASPAALVLYLAHLTYFKNRYFSPKPAYTVLLLGLTVGSIRGASTSLLVGLFGLPAESNWTAVSLRALNAGILAGIAFPTISLLLLTWDQWQKLRREAIEEYLRTYSDSKEQSEHGLRREIALLEEFSTEISAKLNTSRHEFEQIAQLSLQSYWHELATNLRTTSQGLVRPLSHEISKIAEIADSSKISRLLYMLRNIRIEPTWATLAFLTSEYRYFVKNMGFGLGNMALTLHALAIYLVLYIFKRLRENYQSKYSKVGIFALIFPALFISMHLLQDFIDVPTPLLRIFFEALLGFFTVAVIGCISAFRHYQRSEIQMLQDLIKNQEVELHLAAREKVKVSQQVSNYLHGSIQSRLMASALAIEKAGDEGDIETLKREVEVAYSRISFDINKILAKRLTTFEEVHAKVFEEWQGVVNISVNEPLPHESLSQSAINGYEQVLSEAIANSFRHGGATSVKVNVKVDDFFIKVLIKDDGTGLQDQKSGLGTKLFDVVTRGDWRMTPLHPRGTSVELTIPL